MSKRISIYLSLQAAFLLLMPLILKIIEGKPFRTSISDYAYSKESGVAYVMFLTIAGTSYLLNPIINNRHWYNFPLGLCLLGVALTPYKEFPVTHYTCIGLFFITSVASIWLSSHKQLKKYKKALVLLCCLAIASHYFFGLISLFLAEYIVSMPIAYQYFVQTNIYQYLKK